MILYDDKVIILYNSNDREIKQLNKKQLKEVETAEKLEEIKENSSEPCEFKRVALGGQTEINRVYEMPRALVFRGAGGEISPYNSVTLHATISPNNAPA